MADVTLTEQLGAMALIDDMRHRQLLLDEHLDMPARRTEVTRRIKDVYAAQSIAVDDDMIEPGVRRYFDQRLTIEEGRPGTLALMLARMYVTRSKWRGPFGLVMGGVLVALALVIGIWAFIDHQLTTTVQDKVRAVESLQVRVVKDVMTARNAYTTAMSELPSAPAVDAAARILKPVPIALGKAVALTNTPIPSVTSVDSDSRDAIWTALVRIGSDLATADKETQQASAYLADEALLAKAQAKFDTVIRAADYQSMRRASASIADAEVGATKALSRADTDGVARAVSTVDALENLASKTSTAAQSLSRAEEAATALTAMGLTKAENDQVAALVARAREHAQKGDDVATAADAGDLQALRRFGDTSLTLNIVDRAGVKSGVERKFNATGGKSWFLIVEATDAAGEVVHVPIANGESGVKGRKALFGVQVSQAEYDKVKAEKKATGHVSNRSFGTKPARSLTIQFVRAISNDPVTITEW